MKMSLSSVSIDGISITNSKKNSGGAVCRIQLTATMTKASRKALGFTEEAEWPPAPERSGKLSAKFDATILSLEAKQGNTLGEPTEVECKISLADGFTWRYEDPKDESNTTILYSFSARTTDLESVSLITAYKFSSSSADSKGTLSYNKPGEGTAVDMSPDENQMPLEAVEEEGKRGRGRPRKDVQ